MIIYLLLINDYFNLIYCLLPVTFCQYSRVVMNCRAVDGLFHDNKLNSTDCLDNHMESQDAAKHNLFLISFESKLFSSFLD